MLSLKWPKKKTKGPSDGKQLFVVVTSGSWRSWSCVVIFQVLISEQWRMLDIWKPGSLKRMYWTHVLQNIRRKYVEVTYQKFDEGCGGGAYPGTLENAQSKKFWDPKENIYNSIPKYQNEIGRHHWDNTVAHKTIPMFCGFGQKCLVWSDDIIKGPETYVK